MSATAKATVTDYLSDILGVLERIEAIVAEVRDAAERNGS